MSTPAENLAKSLQVLQKLHEVGKIAIKTSDLSRTNRERLLANGFLKEVLKGWYIAVPNHEAPGDSTSWYASYWAFCASYLEDRYADNYFISPEQSLLLHAGNWTVPQQLIIRTTVLANHNTPLPFNTSLWNWESTTPPAAAFTRLHRIRMMDLDSSIVYCIPAMYTRNPSEMRTALAMITDTSNLNRILLEGGHTTIGGRIAGALRSIGKQKMADDIIKTMEAAGYDIRENNPFDAPVSNIALNTEKSPYVNRIKLLWEDMREPIINIFPRLPGLITDKENYLKRVEEIYTTDAYHSLSIERYQVTPALIDKVRDGSWNFQDNENDKRQRDAMAARGYWLAAQKVRESIGRILNGINAGEVADADYANWYRELFAPSVQAGILKPADLAGFRNKQVFISGSRHVPLNNEAVREAMPVFFDLLKQEKEASVKAVLGHFVFVYIHPYIDGNGRIGRFLMNVMLASGGYPWTVIPVQQRQEYMKALEQASVERNIEPFAKFIAYLVEQTMKGEPVAKL